MPSSLPTVCRVRWAQVLLVFAVCASAYVLKSGIEHGGRDLSKLVLHCILIIVSVGA